MNITNMTLEADYAIRIVSEMATATAVAKATAVGETDTKRLDARELAELTGVTLRFTLKIMCKLVAASIVKSYKGVNGGYQLAKDAGNISVGEIIEAVDGQFELARCCGKENCSHPNKQEICRFKSEFDRISEMVRKELYDIRF